MILYDTKNYTLYCGLCNGVIPGPLNETACCHTNSGLVLVGRDRAIHKCNTVTKEDELIALKKAGEMLYRDEDIQNP